MPLFSAAYHWLKKCGNCFHVIHLLFQEKGGHAIEEKGVKPFGVGGYHTIFPSNNAKIISYS